MDIPLSPFLQPTRASHEVDAFFSPTIPIVTKLTAGLKLLYKRIKDGTILPQGQTGVNGKFIPKRNVFIAGRYSIQCCIATRGQTAVLIKAQDSYQQNQLVIIKVVHSTFLSAGLKEVFTLRRLNSLDASQASHTVRLLNSFLHDGHVCLVFPCYDSRPVTDVLAETCLSEQKLCSALRKISRQLLTALAFLRNQKLIHADVKPDNILVEEGGDLDTVTLIDFGNSLNHSQTNVYYTDFEIQTLPYRAPEVHLGIPFGVEIDMWSMGCVLFECYTGQVLFNGVDRLNILNKIISVLGSPPIEMCSNAKFSADIKPLCGQQKSGALGLMTVFTNKKNYQFASFLSGMLTFNPEERMTPWDALQHPFMSADLCIPYYLGDLSTHPHGVVQQKDYEFKPSLSDSVDRCSLSTYGMLNPGTVLKLSRTKKEEFTRITVSSPCNMNREPDETHPCKPLQDQTPCKPLQCHTPYKCGDNSGIITHEEFSMRAVHKKSLTPEKSDLSTEEKCRKLLQNAAEPSLPHNGLGPKPDTTYTAIGVFIQPGQSTCKETKSTLHTHDCSGPLFKNSSQRKVNDTGKRSEAKKYQVSVSKSLFPEPDSECRQKHSVLDKSPTTFKDYINERKSSLDKSPIAQTDSRKKSRSPLDKPAIKDCRNMNPAAMVESHIAQKEYRNKRLLPDMSNSSHSVPNGLSRKRAPDDSFHSMNRSLSTKKIKMVNPSLNRSLSDNILHSSCVSDDELQEADQSSGESSDSSCGDGHDAKVGNNPNLNLTYTMQHTMMEKSLNSKCLMGVLRKNLGSPKRNSARTHSPANSPKKQFPRSHSHRQKLKCSETDAKLIPVQHSDNKGDATLVMNVSQRKISRNVSEHLLERLISEENNSRFAKSNTYKNSCTIPSRMHHRSKAEAQENIQRAQVTISSPTLSSSFNSGTSSRNFADAINHSNAGALLQCTFDPNVSLSVTRSSLHSVDTNQTSSPGTSCSLEESSSPGNHGHSSSSVSGKAPATDYKLRSTGMIFTDSAVAECETTSSSWLAKSRRVSSNKKGHNHSSSQEKSKSIEFSHCDTEHSAKRNSIKSARRASSSSVQMTSVRSSDQVHAFQHLTPDCPDDSRTSSSNSEPESDDLLNVSHPPKKTGKVKMDRLGPVDEKGLQPRPGPLLVNKSAAQGLDLDTTFTVTKGRSPCTKSSRNHNKNNNVQTYLKSHEQKVLNSGGFWVPVINSHAVSEPLQSQKLCNESYVIVRRKSRKTKRRQTVNEYHKGSREVVKKHLNLFDKHSSQLPQNSHLHTVSDSVTIDRVEEAHPGTTDNMVLNDMFESTVDSVNNNGLSSDSDDQTSDRHNVEDVLLLI